MNGGTGKAKEIIAVMTIRFLPDRYHNNHRQAKLAIAAALEKVNAVLGVGVVPHAVAPYRVEFQVEQIDNAKDLQQQIWRTFGDGFLAKNGTLAPNDAGAGPDSLDVIEGWSYCEIPEKIERRYGVATNTAENVAWLINSAFVVATMEASERLVPFVYLSSINGPVPAGISLSPDRVAKAAYEAAVGR